SWRKQEDTQCFRAVFEKLLRTPANNDAVPPVRRVFNHAPRNFCDGLTIDQVKFRRIDAAFKTSAEEGFKKPVINRVGSFLACLDHGPGAISQSRNLFGQQLVPQLPLETFRHQLRDFASPASVFAFDGDDFNHISKLLPSWALTNRTR